MLDTIIMILTLIGGLLLEIVSIIVTIVVAIFTLPLAIYLTYLGRKERQDNHSNDYE